MTDHETRAVRKYKRMKVLGTPWLLPLVWVFVGLFALALAVALFWPAADLPNVVYGP